MPEDKKKLILEAAAQEFAANGYEKTSINRILERAGISKGTAYYYFEDKADLIATVVRHYWLNFMDEPLSALSAFNAEDFWDRIEEIYLHPFADLDTYPWMLGFSRSVWELPEEIRMSGHIGTVFTEAMDWVRNMVQRGRKVGAMRTDLPEELQMELLMALDSVHDRWLGTHWQEMDNLERDHFTQTFVDFLKKALEQREEQTDEQDEGGLG